MCGIPFMITVSIFRALMGTICCLAAASPMEIYVNQPLCLRRNCSSSSSVYRSLAFFWQAQLLAENIYVLLKATHPRPHQRLCITSSAPMEAASTSGRTPAAAAAAAAGGKAASCDVEALQACLKQHNGDYKKVRCMGLACLHGVQDATCMLLAAMH